jgi:hypothetical protein
MSPTYTRGVNEVRQMSNAMLHQLELNKSKGEWTDPNKPRDVWGIFYHAIKLAMAARWEPLDLVAIQEFSADFANEALILCDQFGALSSEYTGESHTVTQAEAFEELHLFSMDIMEVLKKYSCIPANKEIEQPTEDLAKKCKDSETGSTFGLLLRKAHQGLSRLMKRKEEKGASPQFKRGTKN